MIDFACPTCGLDIHVPESAAGKSGKCKKCNQILKVPSASFSDEQKLIERPKQRVIRTVEVDDDDDIVEVRRPSRQEAMFSPVQVNTVNQVNVHQTPHYSNSMGVASLILGILALMVCWIPFLGLLGTPLGALGLLFAAAAVFLALFRRGQGLGFGIAGGAISMLALFITLVIHSAISVGVEGLRQVATVGVDDLRKAARDAPKQQQGGNADGMNDAKGVTKTAKSNPAAIEKSGEPDPSVAVDSWENAGPTASDELVRVEFIEAKVGKVALESIGRKGSSEDDLLQISLVISNLSDSKKLSYRSWSGGPFGVSNAATIEDELGNSYKRIGFGISKVVGQLSNESLYPSKSLTDMLVFEVPIEQAKFLHLTLPSSVFGNSENKELKIKIPVSDIVTKQSLDREKEAEQAEQAEQAADRSKLEEQIKNQAIAAKENEAALRWRTWTDTKGKKVKAQYNGISSGKVKLIAEDGTLLKWSLADLPKDEQDWIKQKPWLKAKGDVP